MVYKFSTVINDGHTIGRDVTKPVFGVSYKARIKPVSPATETSKKIEISLVASFDIKLKTTNSKGADQSAQMRRLVCAFVVRKPPKTGFLASKPSHVTMSRTCIVGNT